VANLVRILSLTTGNSPEALAEEIGDGGGGRLKQAVTDALNAYLRPIRSRRAELAAQPNYIREVLERGIQRAREVGAQTLDDVRRAMNMRI
jgi:tryptophanyl-tRNA synthetase